MLEAAKRAGVTAITCTPHCRDPYFDFEAMWQAYYRLQDAVGDFPLTMGFEVNHRKLMDLGLQWAKALHANESRDFLLEFSFGAPASAYDEYERTIFQLQAMGYDVIIAHPERYRAIQQDIGLAEELVKMGCRLQVSADFIAGGRLGAERRPAIRLLKAGLVSFIASDAHRVKHYDYLNSACVKYGHLLRLQD